MSTLDQTLEPARTEAAACCTEVLGTEFLQALCEPSRAQILRALVERGRSDIGTLAGALPIDRSVISRHLQTLARVGIVRSEKQGRHTFYEVDGPGLISELETLLHSLKTIVPFCCPPGSDEACGCGTS